MLKSLFIITTLILLSGCGSSKKSVDENTTTPSNDLKSDIPMLVILLEYKDIKITSAQKVWSDKIFGNKISQVNNYYIQASKNQFKFIKAIENSATVDDGVIEIALDKNHPDSDVNDKNFESNVYPDLKLALEKADKFIDFSNYDSNADGYISNSELLITFIMAGYEDSFEGRHVKHGVWAHQSCMIYDSEIAILDSVTIMGCKEHGNFAIFGERHNAENPYDATIGVIAHELAHSAFSLPDLYNTADSMEGGIGIFGLMGAGAWTAVNQEDKPGSTPAHFTAWSKVYNGWVTPQVLSNATATLYETASPNYNVVKIPIDATTYYLLENRNNSGYDRGLVQLEGVFSGGVAIWKIDEKKLTDRYMSTNSVNSDTQNKAVDLVEAKGESIIDEQGGGGAEYALYYDKNKNSFLDLVDNISSRGTIMTLNIK